MNSPNHLSGILATAGIFLSVIVLIASPVSAAAMAGPATGGAGAFASGPGAHHAFNATQQQERLSAGLATLGAQGVDVSEPQADLAAGNTTAAMQWLMTYAKAHPGSISPARQHMGNTTQQAGRLQGFLTKLGQKGVDVTQALADLSTGNVKGAMQWLMGYHNAHPGAFGNMTFRQSGTMGPQHFNQTGQHAFNSTQATARLQASLTKLGQQGVDVSVPQADLTSGNTTAAMQWLMAYHKAHPGTAMNANGMKTGNTSAWQKGAGFGMHRGPFGNQTAGHHAMMPTPAQGA